MLLQQLSFASFWQALGLKRDDTFSVTMLGHCIEMYIGDTDAYIGKTSYIGKTTSFVTHAKTDLRKTFVDVFLIFLPEDI